MPCSKAVAWVHGLPFAYSMVYKNYMYENRFVESIIVVCHLTISLYLYAVFFSSISWFIRDLFCLCISPLVTQLNSILAGLANPGCIGADLITEQT